MLVYGSYEHVPILGAIDDLYRMPAMETESQKLAVYEAMMQNYCNFEFGTEQIAFR